ncbi:MAG: T9SS type A sorting domain-containing protein [Bacteroidota bacterium]
MRYISLFLIFIYSFSCALAQDWIPIRPGEKYNYCYNAGIINTTIWVDSINHEGADSVYYLNRLFNKIAYDTIVKNSPVFLQREIRFHEDLVVFSSPNQYIIPLKLNVGDQWVFDSTNTLEATMTEIYSDSILGVPDSVKKIAISDTLGNQYTVLLSKSFGILSFPDFDSVGSYYKLIGLEIADLGEQMPMAREIYNPHIGDKYYYFEKSNIWGGPHSRWGKKHTQYKIIDVNETASDFYFIIKGLYLKATQLINFEIDTSFGYILDTIREEPEMLQLYNNQAFITGWGNYDPVYFEWDTNFNATSKTDDFSEYKESGNGDTLVSAASIILENKSSRYVTGIGKFVSDHYYGTGSGTISKFETLKALQKSDYLYGEFLDDCFLLSPEIKSDMQILSKDTTISLEDTLTLRASPGFDSYNWWVTGRTGNQDTIIATDYGYGLHVFGVEIGYYNCIMRDSIIVKIGNEGINDIAMPNEIQMWMKSLDEVVLKNISTEDIELQFQIIDQNGGLVFKQEFVRLDKGKQEIINISNLTHGVYVIRSITDSASYTKKIIY